MAETNTLSRLMLLGSILLLLVVSWNAHIWVVTPRRNSSSTTVTLWTWFDMFPSTMSFDDAWWVVFVVVVTPPPLLLPLTLLLLLLLPLLFFVATGAISVATSNSNFITRARICRAGWLCFDKADAKMFPNAMEVGLRSLSTNAHFSHCSYLSWRGWRLPCKGDFDMTATEHKVTEICPWTSNVPFPPIFTNEGEGKASPPLLFSEVGEVGGGTAGTPPRSNPA